MSTHPPNARPDTSTSVRAASGRPGAVRTLRPGLASTLVPALLGLLVLTGCGRQPPPLAGCTLAPGATVLAIGDSLTRGHGAEGAGYAEQLQALLTARPERSGVRVINLGIDGERSAGLAARIDAALAEHRPAVVLLTSGGNDFLRGVDEQDTRRHLHAALAAVQAVGATPVLFAIPQPGLGAVVGRPSEHPLYAELARDTKTPLIDGVVAEVLSDPDLKSDPIHPNRAGYARMAQAADHVLQRCR